MSILKILSGIGVVGVTGAGVVLGLLKKKDEDAYQSKMNGYRKVAQTARDLISNNTDLNKQDLVVMPPDSPNWGKRLSRLQKYYPNLENIFPEDVIRDSGKFRDYCYQQMEERMDDLKETGDKGLYMYFFDTNKGDPKKLFWEPCVPNKFAVQQLSDPL